MSCKGDGSCLYQLDDCNYKEGYGDPCEHQCKPIDCLNFIICESNYPQWCSDCHHGFCVNCSAIFGCKIQLLEIEKEECCICYEETTTMAQFPHCRHYVCILCYKKIYYDNEEQDDEDNYNQNDKLTSCPFCRKTIEHDKWWSPKK